MTIVYKPLLCPHENPQSRVQQFQRDPHTADHKCLNKELSTSKLINNNINNNITIWSEINPNRDPKDTADQAHLRGNTQQAPSRIKLILKVIRVRHQASRVREARGRCKGALINFITIIITISIWVCIMLIISLSIMESCHLLLDLRNSRPILLRPTKIWSSRG